MTAEARSGDVSNDKTIKWPEDWEQRLDPKKWHPYVLPVGKTSPRWRQTAPIPTFHSQTPSGKHNLRYLTGSNLGIQVVGNTLEEAAAALRRSLPFDIEMGRELPPSDIHGAVANEIAHFFRQKP